MKFLFVCSGLLLMSISTVQADTARCRANAAGIVAEMRQSNDYPDMTDREINIARQAAIAACDATFSDLESSLTEAQQIQKQPGIDPGVDPIGWLKEQWNKEPSKKKGIERLKKRGR